MSLFLLAFRGNDVVTVANCIAEVGKRCFQGEDQIKWADKLCFIYIGHLLNGEFYLQAQRLR